MPDTQVMAGVNVEQVMLSPLGQYCCADPRTRGRHAKADETTGFDPRRDVREILVSDNGEPKATQDVLLVRGAFDVPKIVEAAVAEWREVETYKGVPIIQGVERISGAAGFHDRR